MEGGHFRAKAFVDLLAGAVRKTRTIPPKHLALDATLPQLGQSSIPCTVVGPQKTLNALGRFTWLQKERPPRRAAIVKTLEGLKMTPGTEDDRVKYDQVPA